MTDGVENTDTTEVATQQPELISAILRCYRDNFWLFWRVMLPFVVLGFLFHFGLSLFESLSDSVSDPKNLWRFDTARGLAIREYPREDFIASGSVDSGMIFSFHAFSIGFLWLAICPLTYVIVRYYNGVEVTMQLDSWGDGYDEYACPCYFGTRLGNSNDPPLSGADKCVRTYR